MALVAAEYHGSFGVWVEQLYREIRAGKTSIISVSASHHVSKRELSLHRAFSGVPYFYSWYGGWADQGATCPYCTLDRSAARSIGHFTFDLAGDGRIRGCRRRGGTGALPTAHMENLVQLGATWCFLAAVG